MQQTHTITVNIKGSGEPVAVVSKFSIDETWLDQFDREFSQSIQSAGLDPSESFADDLSDGIIGATNLIVRDGYDEASPVARNLVRMALRLAVLDNEFETRLTNLPLFAQVDVTYRGASADVCSGIAPFVAVLSAAHQPNVPMVKH